MLGSCQRFKNVNGVIERIEPLNIVDKSDIRIESLTGLVLNYRTVGGL